MVSKPTSLDNFDSSEFCNSGESGNSGEIGDSGKSGEFGIRGGPGDSGVIVLSVIFGFLELPAFRKYSICI